MSSKKIPEELILDPFKNNEIFESLFLVCLHVVDKAKASSSRELLAANRTRWNRRKIR
jgi:hypothetical protein